MSTIVTRSGKGTPLTNTEVDANFTNLNTDKAELSGANFTGNLSLGDNVKLQLGNQTDGDLRIYHNPSVGSIIEDQGAGALFLRGDNSVQIETSAGVNMLLASAGGAVTLYNNGSPKIATTSSGILVTGNAHVNSSGSYEVGGTASGTTAIGSLSNSLGKLTLDTDSTRSIHFKTGGNLRQFIDGVTGDISFYDGSGNQGLFWDSSTSRLGLGTTVPTANLEIQGTSVEVDLDNSSGKRYRISSNTDSTFKIEDKSSSATRLTINADGSSVFSGAVTSTGLTVNGNLATVGVGGSSAQLTEIRLDATSDSGYGGFIRGRKGGSSQWLFGDTASALGSGTGLINYVYGDNPTSFYNNGQLALNINGSQNVNIPNGGLMVGATTAPAFMLDVNHASDNGLARFTSGDADAYITISDVNSSSAYNRIGVITHDMYFNTNNTERMRIDSSGNLLVGESADFVATSTTATGLAVTQDGRFTLSRSGTPMNIGRLGSDGSLIDFWRQGVQAGSIGASNTDLYIGSTDHGIKFHDTSNAIMPWIPSSNTADSSGTLDLGTSLYKFKDAYLSGKISTNTATGLSITADSSNRGILNLSTSQAYQLIGGTHYGYTGYKTGGYHRWFGSDGSEDMRLDSSGNLLVGTTNTAVYTTSNQTGLVYRADFGLLGISRQNNYSGSFNRYGTDGNILNFRKNGTTVGSIGTEGGDLTIGTGTNCGIQFNDGNDAIRPFNMAGNTSVDNAVSLGVSNRRFKDLYLSSGVYLGGTGAANKLDDFETGSWNPTLPNGGSLTVNRALYTKIGRQVSLQFYISAINATNNGGQFQIGGLPFTSSSISNSYSAGSISYCGQSDLSGLGLLNHATYLYFHFIDGTSGNSVANNTFRGLLASSSAGVMIAQISYFTD